MFYTRKLLFSIFALLMPVLLSAQINQTDEKGRKQGVWKKYHPNGKLRYEGAFKNDLPTGTFRYYDEAGRLTIENMFYEGGRRALSKAYNNQGKLLATGVYQDQKKDSIWNYYSDTSRVSQEVYEKGVKTGVWKTWYPNGKLAEEATWSNNRQHGPYKQYFDNGKIKMETTYVNDLIDGKYTQYWPNGPIQVIGLYRNSLRYGNWVSYSKNGVEEFREKYDDKGHRIEQKRINGLHTEYFENEIPKSEINYANGMKHGEFREYYDSGTWKTRTKEVEGGEPETERYLSGHQLKVKGNYFNDQYHGIITWYTPAGKVEKTEKYQNGRRVDP